MAARRHTLLAVLVGGSLVLFLLIALNSRRQATTPPATAVPAAGATQPAAPAVPDPSADTPAETLRTLTAQVAQLRAQQTARDTEETERAAADAAALRRELDDRVNALTGTFNALREQVSRQTGLPAEPVTGDPATAGPAYPVAPVDPGDPSASLGFVPGTVQATPPGYDTVDTRPGFVRATPLYRRNPVDGAAAAPATPATPPPDEGSPGLLTRLTGAPKRPLATIPANATLFDATAMTALIGRAPVDGRVVDPFPVKLIIGKTNLAANGHRIAGIRGAVFSGRATGDWNLGCVRAAITSVLFVHDDGQTTYVDGNTPLDEFGAASGPSGADSDGDFGTDGNPIGWLSDPQGNPCVKGQKITDAPKQIGLTTLLGVAKGAADAYANREVTTVTGNDGGVTSSVTGDDADFIAGAAAAEGVSAGLDEIAARLRDRFDAIYVPPGARVAVHITRPIPIDHDPEGRRLNYPENAHAQNSLD